LDTQGPAVVLTVVLGGTVLYVSETMGLLELACGYCCWGGGVISAMGAGVFALLQ
jgi:hypothetical protein